MAFTQDSDPIDDMGIGTQKILEKVFPKASISPKKEDGRKICLIKGDVLSYKGDIEWEKFNELSKDIKYIVEGNFWIDGNNLTSLKGCPTEVHGSFSCTGNPLESLDGLPKVIKGNVWIV